MIKRVITLGDVSSKDISVDTLNNVLRVKTSNYNIITDNGGGSPAAYNASFPLTYWTLPADPKEFATASAVYSDGIGFFTYDGAAWQTDYFVPGSTFIETKPPEYDSVAAALIALGINKKFIYSIDNIDGAVEGTQCWT